MQNTRQTNSANDDRGYIGEASKIRVPLCDPFTGRTSCYSPQYLSNGYYKHDYTTPLRYYTNTAQGIFANVKDGFAKLMNAHTGSVAAIPLNGRTWPDHSNKAIVWPPGVPDVTATEMRILRTVRGYNGFGPDCFRFNNTNYLTRVATLLANTTTTFASISADAPPFLAEKMAAVESNKTVLSLCSPGVLRVIDGEGKVTSMDGSTVRDEIPTTVYDFESGKAAENYLADQSYKYQVVGTESGTYAFYIDDVTGPATSTVALQNVPLALGEVYTYQVDWDALSQGQKGVTITIDKNGDGSVVDTVVIGPTVDGAQPPTTSAVITGSSGHNGWYTSNVTVALNAIGGTGVGAKSTQYSLDGGPWQLYAGGSPIVIHDEGRHTLQFFSTDFFDNRESLKTVTVNIDKTSPTISGLSSNCLLWPPNHKMVQVATISASDAVSGLSSFGVTGTSNQPASPGEKDVVIVGSGLEARSVSLRAERLGTGNERIYTLTAIAQDVAGNNARVTATCVVPHDQGH